MSPLAGSDASREADKKISSSPSSPKEGSDQRNGPLVAQASVMEGIRRPGTPDTSLEHDVIPGSYSASEDPGHVHELEQESSEDSAGHIHSRSNGRSHMHEASSSRGPTIRESTLTNGEQESGKDAEHGVASDRLEPKPEERKAGSQHRRRGSCLSIPESENSSNGTFIDKGSCEELAKEEKADAQGNLSAGLGQQDVQTELASSASNADAPQPPESAFSTSDLSEQLSGPAQGREEEGLHCTTCQVTATSEEQMAIHKEGKRHRRHLAIAELQEAAPPAEPAEGDSTQGLHCNLCHVTAPSAQHREYHLRGQKHQRREKQHQLMEASAELASNSVNALLSDSDEAEEAETKDDRPEATQMPVADEATPPQAAEPALSDAEKPDKRPLKSPFEEFAPPKIPSSKPPLATSVSQRSVRFNGGLESFSEEPEGGADENGPNPPLPPMGSNVSGSSYKLMSGGSFSSPAAHYCPVCGIIATSEANLEDHYQGRRHARRLQYLSHMPDVERNEHLQRTLTAASSGLFRQGSLVLPSSMDLTAYIGTVAQVHPAGPPAAAPLSMERAASLRTRRSLNKTLSAQQLSWDSINGLHIHKDGPGEATTAGTNEAAQIGETEREGSAPGDEEEPRAGEAGREGATEPQPKCEICGITTTSQAHMEAHKAGRKHRRRVEAAAGRSVLKSSAHYCPLCEISTTSSAHLALHLIGRAHRRRQKALDEGDSLHPVSLLPPPTSANAHDVRCNGDAVSSTDLGSAPAASLSTTNGTSWHGKTASPPPISDRAYSQPEARHTTSMPPEADNLASTRAQSAELKPGKPPPRPSGTQRPPFPAPMPHISMPPSAYPMGMYHLPQPYYQQGSVGPYPANPGRAASYGWWPGPVPPVQHQFHSRPPFQEGVYPSMAQYPMAAGYHSGPPQYPMMGMPVPSYPGSRPPNFAPYEHQQNKYLGPPGDANREWQGQQELYNCEVCNVQTEKLDDLKQHLRGKQHKRRLYNPAKGTWTQ